jgi:hypothetical protein
MAQNFATKQQGWVQRLSNNITGFLANYDAISLLFAEAQQDLYLTGAANVITDATVQAVLPAGTAAALNSAIGAFENANQIAAIVAANRQALELMRP